MEEFISTFKILDKTTKILVVVVGLTFVLFCSVGIGLGVYNLFKFLT
jgi:hypothetical protein